MILLTTMPAASAEGIDANTGIEAWTTTADHRLALARSVPAADVAGADADVDAGDVVDIRVHREQRHQAMVGFGASITDASAWVLQRQMDAPARAALLRELFAPPPAGIGLSFTRLTIGASDFSRTHYTYDDMPEGEVDPQLARFDISPALGEVVPVVREAMAINPQLVVMASPWSAPGWMKRNDGLVKGTLRKEYHDAFARYLVRYVDAMAEHGIPIAALTLQNEPAFEPKDYPGMRLSSKQRADIIGRHLGPMLAGRQRRVAIYDWDHNWEKPEEPLGVLRDKVANPFVEAVAWHCYGGDVSAQSLVRDAYPDKDVYHTECSGGSWEPVRSGGVVLQARNLVIRGARHWARGVLFWNLVLDQDGGPHLGGCDTCRGVVDVDTRDGSLRRTDEYYALAHASRFVARGAVRIGSSEAARDVDNVAFENPDGSIVVMASNSATAPRTLVVSGAGTRVSHVMPARSVATLRWSPTAARAPAPAAAR